MVLGIGRQKNLSKEVAGMFGGGSNSFSGYATTLTNADMDSFASTTSTEPGEWKTLAYYIVGDQESVQIGSKDSDSGQVGNVIVDLRDSTPADLTDIKVRLGYETRAGRSTDPVFEYPVSELRYDKPEDRVKLAPVKWSRAPSGRNGIARAQDRVFVSVREESGSSQDINKGETEVKIPVTKSQE